MAALILLSGTAFSSADKPTSGTQAAASKPVKQRLNINRASVEELQTLPGIGPVLAGRIVEYRQKNPPFRKVEELLIIKGISKRKLEAIRSQIVAP
ncbi:MAG: helix-hairpin-helix domain-containing protein [Acidobacteriota bacterium]